MGIIGPHSFILVYVSSGELYLISKAARSKFILFDGQFMLMSYMSVLRKNYTSLAAISFF